MKGLGLSLLFLLACEGDYNEAPEETQDDSRITETSPQVRKKPSAVGGNISRGGGSAIGGNGSGGSMGEGSSGGQTNQGGESVSMGGVGGGNSMGGVSGMDAMAGACFISGCRYPDVGCCFNKAGACLTNGSCSVEGWERIGCVCK